MEWIIEDLHTVFIIVSVISAFHFTRRNIDRKLDSHRKMAMNMYESILQEILEKGEREDDKIKRYDAKIRANAIDHSCSASFDDVGKG